MQQFAKALYVGLCAASNARDLPGHHCHRLDECSKTVSHPAPFVIIDIRHGDAIAIPTANRGPLDPKVAFLEIQRDTRGLRRQRLPQAPPDLVPEVCLKQVRSE